MTMQNPQTCLSAGLLRQLSHDELSPAELKDVEDHVSDCERCRQLLEVPQSDPQWQDEIVPILRSPLESPHATGDHDGSASEGESLESILRLLGPTDDPHMLGRIGSYEVVGVIGRGGMGVVFKAYEGALNRFVAIKMLLPHLAASGAARKRFAREGQAAAAVIDDNVMPIYSVAEWQGVPYLVTQYSRGATLQKRLQDQGPLELKEILRIGMQTARGLAAAHAQGLVHRDVKPSNILLDGTVERALLTDFGLARAVDDASITRTGIIAGTPQYMSPEQARGGSVDARSDLFGLGCVLYAMCTGRPPFRADNSYAIMRMITDDEPRSIREINPDIPEWLCLLISRLMAKSPDARFGNAPEVAALLEQCLAHVQQPTSVPLPASLVPHATGRRSIFNSTRKGMIAMIGTIGMTLLGMVLWQATEAPDISGQWTSDEWGTVVLEAKEPGQYEGTFGGNDQTGKTTTGNMPPEKEPFTAWGKEVGGLQAGLGLDYGNRRTYGHGQVITLVVRLRNVGKEAVKFEYLRQYLDENPPAVTDADGIAVPQCNTEVMGQHVPVSENLEPGKEMVLETRMNGSNGVPYVLIPSNSKDLKLDENFRPLVVGIGKVQLQIEKVFGNSSSGLRKVDRTLEKLSTGKLELEVNNQPAGSGFSGSSSEILPGSPRASGVPPGSNKGQSGTLHLKWSRVERRFNGTWKSGENRNGKMSLRLVDNEIRGAWTTNKGTQKESDSPRLADLTWTRSVVTVPDGGTVLLGSPKRTSEAAKPATGVPPDASEADIVLTVPQVIEKGPEFRTNRTSVLQTVDETVPSPLKIPLGDIRVDVYAGRGLWYSKDKEVFKLLHSVKSLRGVTFQVHEDGKGDAFTNAVVYDPAPVRAEPAENQKREERIRTIKIAIDEALRAHKVPNVRWLDANGNQQDGPVGKVSAPPTNMAEPEFAFGQPQRVLNVSQVLKEGRALIASEEVVVVRFRVATARANKIGVDTKNDIWETFWELSSEPTPYEDHPLAFRVNIRTRALDELKKNGVEDIAKHFVGKILEVEGPVQMTLSQIPLLQELRFRLDDLPNEQVEVAYYCTNVFSVDQIQEAKADSLPSNEGAKTLDQKNVRRVIEVYVAAALQGDQTTAASVSIVQGKPAAPKQIEPQIQAISRSLKLKQLAMQSIYLNDWEHPTGALAISESVTHAEKQRNGERTGFVVLELLKIEESWFVTGVEFRTKEVADDHLKRFLTANPKSIDLPPLTPNSLPLIDGAKTYNRYKIHSVIEVYVAAALQGDHTTAASVAIVQGKLADPKQIEPQIQAISRSLNLKQLAMHSIYLNDWEHPTGALAISESVTHAEKQRNGERTGFVMLELLTFEENWFVTGIEFRTKDAADEQLKLFLNANPKSIDLPPLSPNSLSKRNPLEAVEDMPKEAPENDEKPLLPDASEASPVEQPLDRKNTPAEAEGDSNSEPVSAQNPSARPATPHSREVVEVQTQDILNRWRKHSESIDTLAVEWKQTVTYSAGSRQGKDLRWKDENGRSFPGKTTDVTNNCRVVIKGGKWRYETIGVQWQSEIEQFAASEDIATSNGTYCVSFVGFDAPDLKSPGQAFVYHSVDMPNRARLPQAAPIFIFARPFQAPIGSLLQWGNSPPTLRRREDDHTIDLVYQIPGQPPETEALYRVDSVRPWQLKHMSYGRMKLDVDYNVDSNQAPNGWTYTERNPDGTISTIITAKVTSWVMNVPVDDEEFTIKLPPGTKVWERTGLSDVRKYWEAGSDTEPASHAVKNALLKPSK